MKIQWQVSTIETASSSFEVSLWLSLSVAKSATSIRRRKQIEMEPLQPMRELDSTIDERSSSLIRGVGIATSIKPSNRI